MDRPSIFDEAGGQFPFGLLQRVRQMKGEPSKTTAPAPRLARGRARQPKCRGGPGGRPPSGEPTSHTRRSEQQRARTVPAPSPRPPHTQRLVFNPSAPPYPRMLPYPPPPLPLPLPCLLPPPLPSPLSPPPLKAMTGAWTAVCSTQTGPPLTTALSSACSVWVVTAPWGCRCPSASPRRWMVSE